MARLNGDYCFSLVHFYILKTFLTGDLVNCEFHKNLQGYLAIEGSILDVEVWGLGDKSAKQGQNAYKKREVLFTEQRRKVGLHDPCYSL